MLETRTEAIRWWKNISQEKKDKYFSKYKENNFSPANTPDQLTGREIEKIALERIKQLIK